MTIYRPYAGIGNPKAPPNIVAQCKELGHYLSEREFTLRTGGGKTEVEEAFEDTTENKELFLPWKKFNDKESKICHYDQSVADIAKRLQPGYEGLEFWRQSFFNRTVGLMLGKNGKSPVRLLICWSQDGVEHAKDRTSSTGFIGIAISAAGLLRIPVFNLKNENTVSRIKLYVDGMSECVGML